MSFLSASALVGGVYNVSIAQSHAHTRVLKIWTNLLERTFHYRSFELVANKFNPEMATHCPDYNLVGERGFRRWGTWLCHWPVL